MFLDKINCCIQKKAYLCPPKRNVFIRLSIFKSYFFNLILLYLRYYTSL